MRWLNHQIRSLGASWREAGELRSLSGRAWSLCLCYKGLGKFPLPARLGKPTEVVGAAKRGVSKRATVKIVWAADREDYGQRWSWEASEGALTHFSGK